MSVEKIKEKILFDAREQAKKIEHDIAEKISTNQAQGHQQVKDIEDRAGQEARRRAEDRMRKDIASAELELRKKVLSQKQKLIQEVFDEAFSQLAKMKGQRYQEFISDLLMKTVETGDEEVIFSKDSSHRIDENILERINQRLKKDGKKGQLRLVEEDREIQGGFILRRGKQEINCSLASLFSNIRESLEPRVAEVLFS